MNIKVKTFFHLNNKDVKNPLEINLKEGSTIMTLIEKLSSCYGDELEKNIYDEETNSYIVEFIVNQKHELPSKELKDGDEVTIIPFMVGG